MTISRRPETAADEPFLRKLIIDTIALQLGASAWLAPMREQLLDMQYRARRAGVRSVFPDSASEIIIAGGVDVGWLVVAELPDQIRIVEIMVREDYRGQGVGSSIVREIQHGARCAGRPVRLGVNSTNAAAIRLYERLGFRLAGGDEVQLEMVWEC
ncbi:MAG TPA: GNAT family N-acetyltransferase [Bryobacteraceae bacterium]|jgi:ribosomal protein S18 acetylase RimI-like enzyme|nr:GNAT family N-acetyltransferase [Bryobacteraceae bacterium]